ncbi:MAG: (2Fe-2S)-binding protein [Clostridia bacterium]|nr:(2Fe-2S)-binding protein [Clostridia bacterium]
MDSITFILNGKSVSTSAVPDMMLADFLREKMFLTGTKKGCGKGECGACTVLFNGNAVNSCMIPLGKADGANILTIEGLSQNGELHPIQQAFVDAGAVQCGFCTPGMIMSTKALLDSNKHPSRDEITEALGGNICRCTGYIKIIEAVEAAAAMIAGKEGD